MNRAVRRASGEEYDSQRVNECGLCDMAGRWFGSHPPKGPVVDDFHDLSATRLAHLVASRQVTSVEVVEAFVDRIDRYNPPLNAIVTMDRERVRQEARKADDAIVRGESLGPLHGVPFTLKDVHQTANVRSTSGHPDYADHIPTADGPVAARLKRAGGILLGKTNVDLFPSNPLGRCNNPWNLARTPGGSSSGSAAAVAAGLTPFDVGTDVGGSVLGPANFCGVYGMRPTEHRVSADGLTLLEPAFIWHALMTPGPITRHVDDLDLVACLLSGPEGHDAAVPRFPWRTVEGLDLTALRVAWSSLGIPLDESVRNALLDVISIAETGGARVGEDQPDGDFAELVGLVDEIFMQLVTAFSPATEDFAPPSLADYLKLADRRARLLSDWEMFFTQWDVLVCPAFPTAAPGHDPSQPVRLSDGRELSEVDRAIPVCVSPANGHPSIVIPVARDREGMPIGVQLIGRRWDDERLIEIARLFANAGLRYVAPPMPWSD